MDIPATFPGADDIFLDSGDFYLLKTKNGTMMTGPLQTRKQ
jgi:hypothetical protein